jgi:hypothetical protein
MLKGKFAVLSLVAAALLCWQVAGVSTVNSGVVDPCNSTASSAAGVHFICPQGDGDALSAAGLTISVTIKDNTNAAVAGLPAADFWLIGCNDLLVLCGGSGSINASAATNAAGQTTITGDISGSGCDTGVRVVCQGIVLGNGACAPICLAIAVRSPDQKNTAGGPPEGLVSGSDFAFFGTSYQSPPKPYFACHDFVGGPYGTIAVSDFAKFGAHFNHQC